MCATLISKALGLYVLTRDLTCHQTFIHVWNEPSCLYSPAALWPVLISCSAEGRRLSCPGWLGKISTWFVRPKTITHPSISGDGRESNSRPLSRESNALDYQAASKNV